MNQGREALTVSSDRMRHLVDDVGRAVDGETVPLLHGRAVDGLLVVGEGHPRNGLGSGDLGPLQQLEREGLIVELHGVDAPGGGPRPDHKMVFHGG